MDGFVTAPSSVVELRASLLSHWISPRSLIRIKRRPLRHTSPCSLCSTAPPAISELIVLARTGDLRRAIACLKTRPVIEYVRKAPDGGLSIAQQLLNATPALLPGADKIRRASLEKSKSSEQLDRDASMLYEELRSLGMLKYFGSLANPKALPLQEKIISTDQLVAQAGVPMSALSPKRKTLIYWQLGGAAVLSAAAVILNALGLKHLIAPTALSLFLLFSGDQLVLRGSLLENVYRTLFPHYAEKVLKHEASHFLLAYLQGCPVRGYVLSAWDALRMGIPGQAGTIFSDGDLWKEMEQGRLRNRTIDRYTIVLMAGIAAEALEYGEAEGGRTDELALLNLLTRLKPPWSREAVFNQARWAVLEGILLLKRNSVAFETLCSAMRRGAPLGDCVACIERNAVHEHWSNSEEDSHEMMRGQIERERESPTKTIEEREKILDERIKAIDLKLREDKDGSS